MWKVFSGLHRGTLGGFRASLREDRPTVPGHRALLGLKSEQGCPSVSCVSTIVSASSAQTCLPPSLQPLQSLHPSPSLQRSLTYQASPSLHPHGGHKSTSLSHYSSPKHNKGCEEEGWSIAEVLHYSTALALSYSLLHQQNDISTECCPVLAIKKSKSTFAQPIQETPRPPQNHLSDQSSHKTSSLVESRSFETKSCELQSLESVNCVPSSHETKCGDKLSFGIHNCDPRSLDTKRCDLENSKDSCKASSLPQSSLKHQLNQSKFESDSTKLILESLPEELISCSSKAQTVTSPGYKLESKSYCNIYKPQTREDIPEDSSERNKRINPEHQSPVQQTREDTAAELHTRDKLPDRSEHVPAPAAAAATPGEMFRLELDSAHAVQLLEQGNPRGLVELRRQSRAGSSVASYYLGSAYEQGFLVTRDLVTARRFYQRAAEAGNPEAEFNLAVFYINGWGGLPRDEGAGRRLLESAAAAGVPQARAALGIQETEPQAMESTKRNGRDLYMLGRSFENLGETKVAAEFYSLAVSSGYSRAKRRLNSLSS